MLSFRRQTATERAAAARDGTSAQLSVMVLSGGIDEFAPPVLDALKRVIAGSETVRLDLAGITHVNSVGVLAWSNFIAEATAAASVELIHCSIDFIDMANLTPMLTEGAEVASFHVPTRCTKCRDEAQQLVQTREIAGPQQALPLAPCARCGGATEAVIDASRYLEFLEVI